MTEEVNTNYLGVTPGIANYITQEVGDVDLSEYYTKSETDEAFVKDDNFGIKLAKTVQYDFTIYGFNINSDTPTSNRLSIRGDLEIVGKNNQKVKFINCTPTDADGTPLMLDVDMTNYYTKSESDSKYVLKDENGNLNLSEYYTKTETDGIFVKSNEFKSKLSTAFQNEITIYGFNIHYNTATIL